MQQHQKDKTKKDQVTENLFMLSERVCVWVGGWGVSFNSQFLQQSMMTNYTKPDQYFSLKKTRCETFAYKTGIREHFFSDCGVGLPRFMGSNKPLSCRIGPTPVGSCGRLCSLFSHTPLTRKNIQYFNINTSYLKPKWVLFVPRKFPMKNMNSIKYS